MLFSRILRALFAPTPGLRNAAPPLAGRGVATLHNGDLRLAGAIAPVGGGRRVLRGIKAGDCLLEARELDHDKAVELVRAFHHLIAPPAGQHLGAVTREQRGQRIGVLLVFRRIVDARPRHPICRHVFPPWTVTCGWPRLRRAIASPNWRREPCRFPTWSIFFCSPTTSRRLRTGT